MRILALALLLISCASSRLAQTYAGVRQKRIEAGVEPLTSSPEGLAAHIRSETAKWAKVIQEGNIKVA